MSDITIIMPTWNKAKYIAQALDSVFAQKTHYSYEILIADDNSTDDSILIAERYATEHPGKIRILKSDINQKLFRNVRRAYAETKTKYFCVLDPDDYWEACDKIETAIDYLEAHPDVTIYATDTWVLNMDGTRERYLGHDCSRDSSFMEFLTDDAFVGHTLGSIFRNVIFVNGLPVKLLGELRHDQEIAFRGDYFRNAIHLERGKVHFEPVCDAVYRITDEGIWQGMSMLRRKLQSCESQLAMYDYFNGRYYQFKDNAIDLLRSVRCNLLKLLDCCENESDIPIAVALLARLSKQLLCPKKMTLLDKMLLRLVRSITRRLAQKDFI